MRLALSSADSIRLLEFSVSQISSENQFENRKTPENVRKQEVSSGLFTDDANWMMNLHESWSTPSNHNKSVRIEIHKHMAFDIDRLVQLLPLKTPDSFISDYSSLIVQVLPSEPSCMILLSVATSSRSETTSPTQRIVLILDFKEEKMSQLRCGFSVRDRPERRSQTISECELAHSCCTVLRRRFSIPKSDR
eukprot:18458_1